MSLGGGLRYINARDWTRTSTRYNPHQALNLARLPNSATRAFGSDWAATLKFGPPRVKIMFLGLRKKVVDGFPYEPL